VVNKIGIITTEYAFIYKEPVLMQRKPTSDDDDALHASLFEAISHPTRIQIIKLLENQALGFAALKRELKITSSGNLSHHLDKLGTLITNNTEGLYTLTDNGHEAVRAIETAEASEKNPISIQWSGVSAVLGGLVFYAGWVSLSILFNRADSLALITAFLGGTVYTIAFFIWHRLFLRLKKRK
jgi:hypothetical protein